MVKITIEDADKIVTFYMQSNHVMGGVASVRIEDWAGRGQIAQTNNCKFDNNTITVVDKDE